MTDSAFSFFHSTNRVIYGPGSLDRLAELAEGRGHPAAILDSFFLGGAIEARLRQLLGPGLRVHGVPQQEPDTDIVARCRDFLAAEPVDLLVALGGGSAMDAAKVARMLLSNPGGVEAIVGPAGRPMNPHPSLFVCVPTTAGTGSEVSESAVISAAGADYKLIFRSPAMSAEVAILDPLLSVTAPPAVTAASGYDAVTHAVEAFTSKAASPMTDPIARAAMTGLAEFLPRAHAEPGDVLARGHCLIASCQAAIAFNSAHLGAAHAIAGALGSLFHVPHGLANALALPWTMAFNRAAMGAKDGEIAAIFGGRTAAEGLSRLRRRVGLDLPLGEFLPDTRPATLDRIAEGASRSGQLRVNPRPASLADLRRLVECMLHSTGGDAPDWRDTD